MSDVGNAGDVRRCDSPNNKKQPPSRVTLTEKELSAFSSSELASRWELQDAYVSGVEEKLAHQEGEIADLRQSIEKLQTQLADSQLKEKVLVRRLAAKEQETQELVVSSLKLSATSSCPPK